MTSIVARCGHLFLPDCARAPASNSSTAAVVLHQPLIGSSVRVVDPRRRADVHRLEACQRSPSRTRRQTSRREDRRARTPDRDRRGGCSRAIGFEPALPAGSVNVGSLFSGIGGIDLGLERAGMRVTWQCESDAFCRRVLRKHWPGVPCHEDIRALAAPEPVDLLAGGFPCQPVSLVGFRHGIIDERWLWPEFLRVIRLLRPRYVFLENVPGLLTSGMGDVLGGLAAIGYDAEWDCLPASAFGAPHRRDRVWVVAYPGSAGRREDTGGPLGDESQDARRATQDDHQPDRDGEGRRAGSVADPDSLGRHGRARYVTGPDGRAESTDGGRWGAEPDVGRMAHGVPSRMDRLRSLGNSVVPQIAEHIGRRILERDVPTR